MSGLVTWTDFVPGSLVFRAGKYWMTALTSVGSKPVQVPAPGIYGPDGGYYYRWNPAVLSLEYAKPPRVSWTAVARRSDARKAILLKIPALKRLGTDAIRAAGLSARPAAAPAPSLFERVAEAMPSMPSPSLPSLTPSAAPSNPLTDMLSRLALRSSLSLLVPVVLLGGAALVVVVTSGPKPARARRSRA